MSPCTTHVEGWKKFSHGHSGTPIKWQSFFFLDEYRYSKLLIVVFNISAFKKQIYYLTKIH